MSFQRLRSSVCWEIGSQSAKLGFGSLALTVLFIINYNLQHLSQCLLSANTKVSFSACNYTSFGKASKIQIKCCNEHIEINVDNRTLATYDKTSARDFIAWINQCRTASACETKKRRKSTHCAWVSFWRENYICFEENGDLKYIVIGQFQFHALDVFSVVSNVIKCRLK